MHRRLQQAISGEPDNSLSIKNLYQCFFVTYGRALGACKVHENIQTKRFVGKAPIGWNVPIRSIRKGATLPRIENRQDSIGARHQRQPCVDLSAFYQHNSTNLNCRQIADR